MTARSALPRLSARDSAAVTADVLLPFVLRGPIARRPRVVGLAQRMDADSRAVRRLQAVRARYGPGPVLAPLPGRTIALILSPTHVGRVLHDSPDTFATANREKRAALSHFQPHGVLISTPTERAERRPFNGAVLQEHQPLHDFAGAFTAVVNEEAQTLVEHTRRTGVLEWDTFITVWWRIVRRVVLGHGARSDSAVTDALSRLRRNANLAYLRPRRTRVRADFERRLREHVARADPNSLAALVATMPTAPGVDPAGQMPQWLFAFEPAGMAAFRALALVASHPDVAARVRQELQSDDPNQPSTRPLLRGCVLESLRLWPTTPAILRDAVVPTEWDAGTLPAGAAVMIFAPLFHRDASALPYAHAFAPEVWSDQRSPGPPTEWPLIPFSDGPAICPGRNLVLLTTSTLLACLFADLDLRLERPLPTTVHGQLPGTLSPFHLRFLAA